MSINSSFFPFKNNILYRKSKINKKFNEKIDENINKNIGPYLITNKIAEGNNSKIYLGKAKYTNDEVAIKIISKEILQENLDDLSLILNQIESLKILKHKNIISLYEIYESPKYFYLVMEYFPKKNLIEKIILKKRLNENETLIIFVQLLDALVYMHKMNITHRNIRTEHILFDKNNRPKIIGFNYSTFYEKNKKLDGMFGSLSYTCPEILNEEQYNPELADVWSLGVVLYVMICGYLPFSEEDDEKNKNLIIEGKVEYPKEISNKLKDLLKHMLEVNCNKRYNLQKIIKHPWIKKFTDNKNMFFGGINVIEMKYCVDERILNIIEKYFKNFNKYEIRKNLIENKYNEGTGLYKLLLRKISDMKINSVSDLFSEDFLKYIQNKNNYIDNGNNNLYKKYIEKINNRKNKIENYINDYKKREDDVAKYLINIENIKKSIRNISDINNSPINSELKNNISNNTNQNKEIKYSLKLNNLDENGKIYNEEQKDDDLDIDLIQKFKEEQSKKKIEDSLINDENDKFSQSILSKKLDKSNSQNIDENKNIFKKNNLNNFITNKLDSMKSITPDSKKFINQILIKNPNEDKINESLLYSIKRKQTANFNTNKRKSHIDRGSLLDGYLKKNHPENIRKTLLRFSLFSNISEEEDDEKNNDKKLEDIISEEENNEGGNDEEKKMKNKLKYSLSFMDDGDEVDEGESAFNESSYITRNDTRFISEIKDALKELNNLKKQEIEKSKLKNKEKEKEKELEIEKEIGKETEKQKDKINPNNNINSNLKNNSRFKNNFKRNNVKEKEKIVHFSKFKANKTDNNYNNKNNLIKESVNNFIINNLEKTEEKHNNGNNLIILEGTDFSFNDDLNENIIKSIKKVNILKIKNPDIFTYKNDKLTISKISNIFNNNEIISVSNIENKRNKLYIFTFSFDKHKIKKINIDNTNINNIDKIKSNIDINNTNKIESYEIFDNLYKDQTNNTKNNNIIKYQESIFNKSNNLQSEPNINSSNNSYTSNNRNSSIINIHNELNEIEDSLMFKIKDSNKDTSLDISSIKRNSKTIKDKIKTEIKSKIYDNELINSSNIKRKITKGKGCIKFEKNCPRFIKKEPKKLFISLTEKKKNNNSQRNIIREKSFENKPKSTKNTIKINQKEKNKKPNSIMYKNKFQKLQNEFIHNSNNNFNLNNHNIYNDFTDFKNKKNKQHNINLKKHARYCSLIKNTNINSDGQIIKKAPKLTHIKTASFYENIAKKNLFDIKPDKNINKKEANFNKSKKNKLIENSNYKYFKKININKQNNNNRSLVLIKPINNEQNKIGKRNNNKPQIKDIKSSSNKNNNNNIIHETIKINKKPNKNVENMLLKRKEMVKKIRNCKLILNNLYSGNKCYTANQTEQNHLLYLESSQNNSNIDKLKFPQIKNDINNIIDSPKEHKQINTDINLDVKNINNIIDDFIEINKNKNNLGNRYKTCYNTPKNNLVYQDDKLIYDLNMDNNSNA